MKVPFLNLRALTESFEPQLTETVTRAVASGWYVNGGCVEEFEQAFARYNSCRYCVGTGNGLDALTLALTALKQTEGWADGDEVVVPAFTFIATAEAVCRARLVPVFCDIGADFLMDTSQAAGVLTARTRALLPVHLYGKTANLDALRRLAAEKHLIIVEDAAQSHGQQPGCAADDGVCRVAAYSFYPGKNLGALGDGGAIVTNDSRLAERVRMLGNYGAKSKYRHELHGTNSRLDEIQAAVLSLKLGRLDADNRRRRRIAAIYSAGIRSPHVAIPYDGHTENSVFHVYPLTTPYRTALRDSLQQEGIETLIHYPVALHRQPAFSDRKHQHFPQAERAAAEEISLPISPVMTEEEAHYVVDKINRFEP